MLPLRNQQARINPDGASTTWLCWSVPVNHYHQTSFAQVGEAEDTLPLVERLLRCENEAAHAQIAELLWDSSSDVEAMQQLDRLAQQELQLWEQQLRERNADATMDDATAEG